MSKRILSLILAALTLLTLCAPALASGEPAPDVPAIDVPAEPEATAEPEVTAEPEATAEPAGEVPSDEPGAPAGPAPTPEPDAAAPSDEPADVPEEPADEPSPASVTVSSTTPSAAVYKAALPVLYAYYNTYYQNGYSEYSEGFPSDRKGSDFYYTFYDLDKNGSAELFISYAYSNGASASDYVIVDLFEFVNGKPIRAYNGYLGYRNTLTPLSTGEFRIFETIGRLSVTSVFKLSHNGQAPKMVAGYQRFVDTQGAVHYTDSNDATLTQAQVDKINNRGQALTFSGWVKFLSPGMKRDGWFKNGGKTFYYVLNIPEIGLQTIDGETYYFSSSDGHMLTGVVNTGGGKLRYFSAKDGAMVAGGWINGSGSRRYYAGKDGVLLTGFQTIGSKSYYFSVKDGHLMKGGLVTGPGGKQYYVSAGDGHAMKGGWARGQAVKGRPGYSEYYYLDKTGVVRVTHELPTNTKISSIAIPKPSEYQN